MKTKTIKLSLDSFGSYLGAEKGCFVVRDREGKRHKYPWMENERSEIRMRSGNTVSIGALLEAGFWGIDFLIFTRRGNPVSYLKNFCDDRHVQTRISQYEALQNGKGSEAAKQFVLGKLEGYNELLKKHGLRRLDSYGYAEQIRALEAKDIRVLRNRLTSIEGKFTRQYFVQMLQLFSESIRPEHRRTFKAYDGLNNILNLAYKTLFWRVQIALLKAKLEPYLGFLHALEWGTASLVCDFQELYRYLVDDFVVEYCRTVRGTDFFLKQDRCADRIGKRQFLKEEKAKEFTGLLNGLFEKRVTIPRIRRGAHQEIETLIREEALLFASYLRGKQPNWHPRIVALS